MKTSRRSFFRTAGAGAALAASVPMLSSCSESSRQAGLDRFFNQGDVLLFQGDSITDAGRQRDREYPNDAGAFGRGYAHLIAAYLLNELAHKELSMYNRGISGNKVYQLDERWEKDCLMLKPNVLSILIGVNDYWHMRNGNYDGTPEIYERDFRALLQRTKDALPDLKLVICQPFVLPGTRAVDESWLEPFRPYQESAEKLAGEFGAIWVPFQLRFNLATEVAHATYWAGDGVHPSMAGAQLMAETWLEALS